MNIVTVVNFIRAADFRHSKTALLDTVRKQAELTAKYRMPTSFLLQPDAVADADFVNAVPRNDYTEIGLWLELNKTLVEKSGGTWKYPEYEWHWHPGVDMLCGYEPELRKKIIDSAMEEFREVFGYYPKTVGSRLLDAVSLEYLDTKYGITASLNCKEQWGADSCTLWGGYINQAYYPSKRNAFAPANNESNQINVPIFRMLGNDPIDQYDNDTIAPNFQAIFTPEPTNSNGIGNKDRADWYFRQLTENEPLSFGYAQAGQENSFTWDMHGEGYTMQTEVISRLEKEGKISIMTASDAGEWYKNHYKTTPPSAVVGRRDDKESMWFCNKKYRLGFFANNDVIYIRDLQLFNDGYEERYNDSICDIKSAFYDNIPLIDSYLWCGLTSKKDAGVFFEKDGVRLSGKKSLNLVKYTEGGCQGKLIADTSDGTLEILFAENKITFITDYSMKWIYQPICSRARIDFGKDCINIIHNGFECKVKVHGNIDEAYKMISPIDGRIEFEF